MNIEAIHITQRSLKRSSQIPGMLEAIGASQPLPPITLAEFEDGTVQVEDGHHRFTAYWLSGRRELESGEYILVYKDCNHRPRFGNIHDLLKMNGVVGNW